MNRTIKFRAWDKEKKKFWHDIESEYDTMGRERDELNWEVCSFGSYLDEPERYEVQQFTGLLDKLGKEIYEGDIVRYSMQGDEQNNPMEVDMFNLRLGFEVGDPYMRIDEDSIKVIGNVYENKDLLK